jgi:membrane-associated phospholipid phosphatase
MRSVFPLLTSALLLSQVALAQVPASPDSVARAVPVAAGKASWLRRPDLWRMAVPVTLVALGYVSRNENVLDELKEEVNEETREHFPHFRTSIDDYSRHLPVWGAYGLYALGMKGERGVVPFTVCYGISHALSTSIVSNLKRVGHTQRPDDAADFSSFPSAHTAEAFMTATLLHEQFGRERPWVSVAGYGVATATGAMRMLNNRHWVTDVLAGAGIGFLSAEIVWRLYPAAARLVPGRLSHKLLLLPAYMPGGSIGATLVMR